MRDGGVQQASSRQPFAANAAAGANMSLYPSARPDWPARAGLSKAPARPGPSTRTIRLASAQATRLRIRGSSEKFLAAQHGPVPRPAALSLNRVRRSLRLHVEPWCLHASIVSRRAQSLHCGGTERRRELMNVRPLTVAPARVRGSLFERCEGRTVQIICTHDARK